MYRIFNRLFGWDYIHWTISGFCGISRIYVDYNGNVFYYTHKLISAAKILERSDESILWLTCHPSKYFPEIKEQ